MQKPLFAELEREAGKYDIALPFWNELHSNDDATRSQAYQDLAAATAKAPPELVEKIYRVLLLSVDDERKRGSSPMKGVIEPTAAHPVLRKAIYQTRMKPSLRPRSSEINHQMDLGELEREDELRSRMVGSAHTGAHSIVVSPAYTIAARNGHVEMMLDTAAYSQELGDPSRFSVFRGMELKILPSQVVVELDNASISRWTSALLQLQQLPQTRTADADMVQSIFQGGGLGVGLKMLEFAGNKWRNRSFEAKWITPEVIVDLITSEGFRNYLTLSLGVEIGTVWMRDRDEGPQSRDRTWVGAPIETRAQASFDRDQDTILQLAAAFTPRFSSLGKFESETKARLSLSRRLGEVLHTELRLVLGAERYVEDNIYHFNLGIMGRRF